ncbi:hypothetical protein ACXWOF_10090, partial [Streptococcus pyogenes]
LVSQPLQPQLPPETESDRHKMKSSSKRTFADASAIFRICRIKSFIPTRIPSPKKILGKG